MNIVEREAVRYYDEWFGGVLIHNIKNLKSKLTTKLSDFSEEKAKLDFLKILRERTKREQAEHKKHCTGCNFDEERENGLFVIDQEIKAINRYYTFEANDSDKFSAEEESSLHSKLNDIIQEMQRQGHRNDLGHEILFNEIESLKNHFNLGKKTWFQLVKGKLVDLTAEKVVDAAIAGKIFSNLRDGFSDVIKQLH